MTPRPSQTPGSSNLRSKLGCMTCRKAKVKCDEAKETCGRCTKLKTSCSWPPEPVPIRDRRVREGTLRRRQYENWRPQRIAAKVVDAPHPQQIAGSAVYAMPPPPQSSKPRPSQRDPSPPTAHSPSETLPAEEVSQLGPSSSEYGYEVGDTGLVAPQGMPANTDILSLLDDDFLEGLGFSLPGDFEFPLPTCELLVEPSSAWSSLPSLVELTREEHEALDHFQKDIGFSIGSKSPMWSTHTILLQLAAEDPTLLHLLLAASFSELDWKNRKLGNRGRARMHYCIGQKLLHERMSRVDEPNHVVVMASFWLLFLHQRRRAGNPSLAYAELSRLMSTHVQKYGLDSVLSSSGAMSAPPRTGSGTSLSAAQMCSLLSRLLIWLFWADSQSCFLGGGGSLAKTFRASPRDLLSIYDKSRAALELYWGFKYPPEEIADDLQNWPALELLHATWVAVQRINDAYDSGQLTSGVAADIAQGVETLRSKYSTVFRLAESPATRRTRLLANADWAVCNYYALIIYLSRSGCPVGMLAGAADISTTASRLVLTAQRTLLSGGRAELDRFQWALFWGGLETYDPVYREWIQSKLVNSELSRALEVAFTEQQPEGGSRITIERLRAICREVVVHPDGSSEF